MIGQKKKKNILGNLNNQSFLDIWMSDKAKISRQKLYESIRDFHLVMFAMPKEIK